MTPLLSATDLLNGKKGTNNFLNSVNIVRPLQVLSRKEKDDEWKKKNMDWLEMVGLQQVRAQAKRIISNYKIAYGIIDKSDYIISQENDYNETLEVLLDDEKEISEIKNYPIATTIINVLLSEFAKRSTDVVYIASDERSINEVLEKKKEDIEKILLDDVNNRFKLKLLTMQKEGADEQEIQQLQQLINNNNAIKQLPEVEEFYRSSYRSIYEQWAAHQHAIDVERYRFYELENQAMVDLMVCNREFWHFNMLDDDYDIELWDTATTFYHRSPTSKYISNASYVGNIRFATLAEVIDTYGKYLSEEEIHQLESALPVSNYATTLTNKQNDGVFYDTSASYADNSIKHGSLDYVRHITMFDTKYNPTLELLLDNEDYDFNKLPYFRITKAYWVSYRKVGLYVAIDKQGNKINKIVDEDFVITNKPVYNKQLLNEESERTLIFGEHIEWVWIKEIYGGIKISPNNNISVGNNSSNSIYLGINKRDIDVLPFQFKGDNSLFGAKLPVEGIIDNYAYGHSMSIIDLIKPYQIGYNIVNNQIADILLDELGTVIVLDQNTLPKHSLGEDWGATPYENAYIAMKNFSMLPLDTTLRNTESSVNFQHYQKLDLSQTERLLSRIQLANFFKMQALEVIGISPQRLGTPIGQKQTATEVENSVVSSYAQTEKYFITHCDYIMPRVHEMRTQLSQYYMSNKPSFRMQIMLKDKERIFFGIDGNELFNRDLNIFITTKANYRAMIDEIKRAILNNPTAGTTIYDLVDIIKSKTPSELNDVIDKIRKNAERMAMQQYENEQKLKQMDLQTMLQEKERERQFIAQQKELDRQNKIMINKIKGASGLTKNDINDNQISDYEDFISNLKNNDDNDINELKKKTYENKNEIAKKKLELQERTLDIREQANMLNYNIEKKKLEKNNDNVDNK